MTRRFLTYLGIAILLLTIPVSLISGLRNLATRMVAPMGRFFVARSSGLRNAVSNIEQLGELRDEKTTLQSQVITLQQQLIDQENIKAENDSLRKQLGVTGIVHDTPKVFAQIALYNNTDPLDPNFTVDAGSKNGIKVGQPAVYQGVLIGRVISVRDNSAVVRSIRSQKSEIQAWISFDQELGSITGTGSGVVLKFITQGISIPDQSVVETSGLGGTLPQGILIGNTGTTLSEKSDTSQTFGIQQPIDPTSIQSMFILLVDTI